MATAPSKYNPLRHLKKVFGIGGCPPGDTCVPSFDERREDEEAYTSIKRGTRMVPIDRIVGSVGRYHDFDSHFMPRTPDGNEREEAILKLLQQGRQLPPISLYQIKDEYFILDGHHRFTAARKLGHREINACILELLPSKDTLENRLYLEKIDFRDRAGLNQTIDLTEPGQFRLLEQQIREHREFLGRERQQDVTYEQAAADWYRSIYHPLATLIRNSGLVKSFAGRTVDDLYLYISVQQWIKGRSRKYGIEVDKLIPKNMEEFRSKMAEHKEQGYPEMRRPITVFILINAEGIHEQKIIDKLLELPEVRELHCVHGSIDIIVKITLMRDLLASDAELISEFVNSTIRSWKGVVSTQTLMPGFSRVKDGDRCYIRKIAWET
ncbi:MAG: Lrp/AsnC ligand binding domain-containing protein [Desulfoprunum sp.]|uniref:Lrp/AsnC ligand binding domain-containing protein n=1 Tax=Desulfoprunum sp. TaxID=2020866 RepID=UPI003C771D8D